MSLETILWKGAALGVFIMAASSGTAMAAVATRYADVHVGPGVRYQVIDQSAGDHVRVTDQTGNW